MDTDIVMTGLTNIAGMWALAWYEVNRQWNRDELSPKGFAVVWMPVVRYRVALVIAGILIPDWLKIIPLFMDKV